MGRLQSLKEIYPEDEMKGSAGLKSQPMRITHKSKAAIKEIAQIEGITQGDVIERFVKIYDVDDADREKAWSIVFGGKKREEELIEKRKKELIDFLGN